jgi:hypothetical protein
LFDAEPERFRSVVRTLLARLINPPRTPTQYCEKLRQVGLKQLAVRLESLADEM